MNADHLNYELTNRNHHHLRSTVSLNTLYIISFTLLLSACNASHKQTIREQTVSKDNAISIQHKVTTEESSIDEVPELNPICTPTQISLFKKATASTKEYAEVFLSEVSKMEQHFQGMQLSMRRSHMMIFFGDGLIKRLTMIEDIADCLPLYKQYLNDRQAIFNQVERLSD